MREMTVRTKLFFALLLVLLLAAVGCLSGVLCTEETVTVRLLHERHRY